MVRLENLQPSTRFRINLTNFLIWMVLSYSNFIILYPISNIHTQWNSDPLRAINDSLKKLLICLGGSGMFNAIQS